MDLEEYLKLVVPLVGPNAAFDMAKEAKFAAIEAILIEKGIVTKEAFSVEIDGQLGIKAGQLIDAATAPGSPFRKAV